MAQPDHTTLMLETNECYPLNQVGVFTSGVKVKVAQVCLTLCNPPLSMELSGKNTGVGSRSLLQGIFLNQGSNPGLHHGNG